MKCITGLVFSVLVSCGLITAKPVTAQPPKQQAGPAAAAQQNQVEARLMCFPDISQDRVVFAYAGHLWIAPRSGGLARRLSMREGAESFPRFSRDGKLVAFTANYDGNSSVYLVSTDGGTPRRLTFAPTKDGDQVLGWSLDGRRVLFASTKYGELRKKQFGSCNVFSGFLNQTTRFATRLRSSE